MVSSVKLAELWQTMGYRVVVVCMGKPAGREEISPTLVMHRVQDFFLPDPLNYGIAPTFLFHVLRAYFRERPAITVVNKVLFWSSLVTPFLRLIGAQPIVTTDTLVGITWHPRGFFPKIIMAVGAWTAGWLVLLSAYRVVLFHPQPQALLKFLGIVGKSRVIPTGVNTNAFGNPTSSHRGLRPIPSPKQTPNLKSQTVVTYVGRLESVKGVDDFLAAVVPLKKEYPRLLAQVVGWYRHGHPLVAQYQGDVDFTGLRDDIPAILGQTDIFVLPSYSEGLSNALMEAMASGCACIATHTGGNAYLIEDGVSGLLFPPGDREALRGHLRALIKDSEKRSLLGHAARKRIEEAYSTRVAGEKYATLFRDVLGHA